MSQIKHKYDRPFYTKLLQLHLQLSYYLQLLFDYICH